MPRGPLRFKQNDLARALRAAAKAGPAFYVRVEQRTGDILILPGAPTPVKALAPQSAAEPGTPEAALEDWLNGAGCEASGGA